MGIYVGENIRSKILNFAYLVKCFYCSLVGHANNLICTWEGANQIAELLISGSFQICAKQCFVVPLTNSFERYCWCVMFSFGNGAVLSFV